MVIDRGRAPSSRAPQPAMSTALVNIAEASARPTPPDVPGVVARQPLPQPPSDPSPVVRLRPRLRRWWLGIVPLVLLAGATPLGATGSARPPGDWVVEPVVRTRFTVSTRRPASTAASLGEISRALGRCRATLRPAERERIAEAIAREADRHGYDRLFVQALVEVESTCRPAARSPRGAVGLAQVLPDTARAVARAEGVPWRGESTLLDPDDNLRIGIAYLNSLEERFGDLHVAVAAYNLGPERVAGMKASRARSADYVRKVLDRYRLLVASAASPLS